MPSSTDAFSLESHKITVTNLVRNATPSRLVEDALQYEGSMGTMLADSGALVVSSGKKTGRSPKDKRIVEHPDSVSDVWWGNINIKLPLHTFEINRERAIDYLNICDRLYVMDGYAGWDPACRLRVRIIASRAYHALFMHNMLIRPTEEELATFGEPDYVIYNAGHFSANRHTEGMTSKTSVDICFETREVVILGTEYAGEMKKGIFSIMNFLMPLQGILSMHCSANMGEDGDTALFFGLSGTGKTTLSADPRRRLIGDDEHCWSDRGIFNIEGGCYAKCINLSAEKEPQIHAAIQFGTVLENVACDRNTRRVDFADAHITENTRAAYPIEYIDNAVVPCLGGHPNNIIFLTCDAFGVLPPVSRLTSEQAMYHFISGYTAKVAGTEDGVTEPSATFSACFGEAFMVLHPNRYAELLAEKMARHGSKVWLVNTGWTGGGVGVGRRIALPHTRAIIDAILDGQLEGVAMRTDPVFGLAIPANVPGVPDQILTPRDAWKDSAAYDERASKLAELFRANFANYANGVSDAVKKAGPIG